MSSAYPYSDLKTNLLPIAVDGKDDVAKSEFQDISNSGVHGYVLKVVELHVLQYFNM